MCEINTMLYVKAYATYANVLLSFFLPEIEG